MQAVGSRVHSPGWIVSLLVIALTVPFVIAALPGGPVWILARHVTHVGREQRDMATLAAIRTYYDSVRQAEPTTLTGQSRAALESIDHALTTLTGDTASARACIAALRHAMSAYEAAAAPLTASLQQPDAAADLAEAGASLNAIDRLIGQLTVEDERALRAPLDAMRLAATEHFWRPDSETAQGVENEAETLSGRLLALTIPNGTRAAIAARVATWRHVLAKQGLGMAPLKAGLSQAAISVERALEDAERGLATDQRNAGAMFELARKRFEWILGATFLALMSLAAFRHGWPAAFHHGMMVRSSAR